MLDYIWFICVGIIIFVLVILFSIAACRTNTDYDRTQDDAEQIEYLKKYYEDKKTS